MLPDRVSNPGPLTYESDALPIALRGPAALKEIISQTDRHLVNLSSKTYVFEDKMTNTSQFDKSILSVPAISGHADSCSCQRP